MPPADMPLPAGTRSAMELERAPKLAHVPDALGWEKPSFEKKYLVARSSQHMVTGYLEGILIPDPNYSEGQISSIYYDTPCLEFYQAKRASEFLKTKVRLRWYGKPLATAGSVRCYLEVKSKIGAQRRKDRVELEAPAHALTGPSLGSEPYLVDILAKLIPRGHMLPAPLFPMIVIQYQRRRFIDPTSGARVAIDSEILVPRVNQQFIPGSPPARVEVCVLEIKGDSREIPDWVRPIRHQVRPDAFSKYSACFEHLLQPAGRRE